MPDVIIITSPGPQGPPGPPGSGSGASAFPFTGSAIISGSLVVTGSIISTQGFTGSLFGTSSYALTASFALNGGGTTVDTGSFVTTSSFNSFTSSINSFTSSYNTGSFSGSFIGSLTGTSSYSNQALSSSYALTASFALNAGTTINTGSFVTTSSFNSFTSSINTATSSFVTNSQTSSFVQNNQTSSFTTTSSFNSFTSSYSTGSFTGSFTGSLVGTSSYSNQSLSSSYALTASFALNAGTTINTGSFVTTSSFNSFTSSVNNFTSSYNTGSFTGSFTGSLLGTSSQAITASNTVSQNTILTNQTVGGLTSGTTLAIGTGLESILRTMLVTYIPPTLTSLVMRLGGSSISTAARDVGNSFTTNTASFSATADNPTSIFPLSSSFTASGADIGTQTFYFGNNVLSTTNTLGVGSTYTINKATASGTVTFTVNGRRSDTGATITAATTSIQFQWRNYLAATSTIPVDNATAQTVVNASVTSALDTDRGWTATCTAANDTVGNFTYVIYPASYGDLSNIIQNGALSVLSAFTNLGDFTITNAYAASISVRIYKSNSDKAFASGTTLAIS